MCPRRSTRRWRSRKRSEVHFKTTKDGANYMPSFPTPPGEDETSWFIKEVTRGLHKRFGDVVPSHVRDRADFLSSRSSSPWDSRGYFLVVADFINWSKDNGIRVGPGRGSARGRWLPMPWASRTSTPSTTACCSNGSSTPSASPCRTSWTWTSTSGGDEVIEYVRAPLRRRQGQLGRHLWQDQDEAGPEGFGPGILPT